MRGLILLAALTSLIGCAAVSSDPPPPRIADVPSPPIIDINSGAFQRQIAAERSSALQDAIKSGTEIKRTFYVGWELHHGYYLIPVDSADEWIIPDFLDDEVIGKFDDFIRPGRVSPVGEEPPHIGKRIVCECTGLEWFYHSQKQFAVRAAKLQAR